MGLLARGQWMGGSIVPAASTRIGLCRLSTMGLCATLLLATTGDGHSRCSTGAIASPRFACIAGCSAMCLLGCLEAGARCCHEGRLVVGGVASCIVFWWVARLRVVEVVLCVLAAARAVCAVVVVDVATGGLDCVVYGVGGGRLLLGAWRLVFSSLLYVPPGRLLGRSVLLLQPGCGGGWRLTGLC